MKNGLVSGEEKMNYTPPKSLLMALAAGGLLLTFSLLTSARAQDQDQQPSEVQTPTEDPIGSLRLTPEQRERIRAINQQNRAERIRVNQQLRTAQAALEDALDTDSPSESLIEQRMRDVNTAQAAHIRMRVSNELRIRSVLTPDQLKVWREIRNRQSGRRRLNNPDGGRRNLPNQRNGIAPLYPNNRRNPGATRPRP
jgi:Spy/CpxP family protein refolding chaperone